MCLDSCLKGRQGKCGFGCSTLLGIRLITFLSLTEMGLIGYIFFEQLSGGVLNFKVCTWLFLVLVRVVMYLSMCSDGISKRRNFMWALIGTTILEVVLFIIVNVELIDG